MASYQMLMQIRLFMWSLFSVSHQEVTHMNMSIAVLVQFMLRQSYWGDFVGIASDTVRRHNLITNSPNLVAFTIFLRSSSAMIPEPLVGSYTIDNVFCDSAS